MAEIPASQISIFASFLKLIAPVGVTDGSGEKREHYRQKPKILHFHLLYQKVSVILKLLPIRLT
jgi:hypothetical protein